MAGRLIVQLDQPHSMGDETPGLVSAEVVRMSDGSTQSFPLAFATAHLVEDLEPGGYAVRAFLPSAEVVSRAVDVGDADVHVTLRPPHTPHEWLGWETVLGKTLAQSHYRQSMRGPSVPDVWMRMWEPKDGWQAVPWPKSSTVQTDLELWKVYIPTPTEQPLALQIGGPAAQWQTAIIPPASTGLVLVHRRPHAKGGLEVNVGMSDRRFEFLLRYLQSGDRASLVVLGETTAQLAENMLFDKIRDPLGAVVGGYVLLALGDFQRMHNWSENLSEWFEDIADGAIIHATRLMREGRPANDKAVRAHLLKASARPAPVLTQGVDLLHRGLRLLSKTARPSKDIATAYSRVDTLANALDWSKVFTTYRSLDPNTPDVAAPEGIPTNTTHLQWLPEGDGALWASLPLSPGERSAGGGWVRPVIQVRSVETGGWEVSIASSAKRLALKADKADAEAVAREFAIDQGMATLVVEHSDGSTQEVHHFESEHSSLERNAYLPFESA